MRDRQDPRGERAATLLGMAFVALGAAGWLGALSSDAFTMDDTRNFVNLATGAVLLVAARLGGAAGATMGLGLVYFMLAIAGLLPAGLTTVYLAPMLADHSLRAIMALLLLAVGLMIDAPGPFGKES